MNNSTTKPVQMSHNKRSDAQADFEFKSSQRFPGTRHYDNLK
jgi:hypothetical protein